MGGVSFYVDIKLLTPNHQGLNKLIYICEQDAAEFDIKSKFNGAKSKYMVYQGIEIVLYITNMFL